MHRCSMCDYAVRCVDHLPPVVAKRRYTEELLDEVQAIFELDDKTLNLRYSSEDLDRLDLERARLADELTGWILNEEILELQRRRISAGQDDRRWFVQKPEIIERDLKKVIGPTSTTTYTLARLGECISYPTMQSPTMKARFDLLRRQILAKAGNLRAALSSEIPIDPAAECAATVKIIMESTGMDALQLCSFVEKDEHMLGLPSLTFRLLSDEEGGQASAVMAS